MRIKKTIITVIFIAHILLVLFSCVLLIFHTLGGDYYKYIYAISLNEATDYKFDSFIAAWILSIILFIVDCVGLIRNIILHIGYKLSNKTQILRMKQICSYIIMMIFTIVSFYIIFTRYNIFIA